MKLLGTVICFLCVNFLRASESYRVAVLQVEYKDINAFTPFIYEAGQKGVDLLILPAQKSSEIVENYDEAIKSVSSAAKQAGLYVVLNLNEEARCQLGDETIRSNLVFNREGSIVAVYRKPVRGVANCTSSSKDLVTFTTDFGVTFGLLMEEDIILHNVEHLQGLKNFVLSGGWQSEMPFLSAAQFAFSWSYITNANLVSTTGIYAGKAGLKTGSDKLVVADLQNNGGTDLPAIPFTNPSSVGGDDLSQYIIRPLDLGASINGLKETVCHDSFCCEFYVKTSAGTKSEATYGLAAFNGVKHLSGHHNIGAQNCALFSCPGLNTKSCALGAEYNNTNIFFERISIAANFTKQNNAQFPIVQATSVLPTEKFKFNAKSVGISKQVTLEIGDSQNIVNFGIFGRDFERDFETDFVFGEKNNTETKNDIYDFIYNEDVQEFVDYVWIRLRVLIVVVSIYILEMM